MRSSELIESFWRTRQLVSGHGPDYSLEGPVSWRADRAGFSGEVKELASEFGYY